MGEIEAQLSFKDKELLELSSAIEEQKQNYKKQIKTYKEEIQILKERVMK